MELDLSHKGENGKLVAHLKKKGNIGEQAYLHFG